MAIFCLATSLEDMQRRLGNIIVGYTRERKPVMREIEADGAMTVLLKDALGLNLVINWKTTQLLFMEVHSPI